MIATAGIGDLPISVVDVETTGLHPRGDRIIEIAVVRIEPDGKSRTIFDNLVNPRRPVSATEIHGITDDHGASTSSEARTVAPWTWSPRKHCR